MPKPTPPALLIELLAETEIDDYPSDLAVQLAVKLIREFDRCGATPTSRKPAPEVRNVPASRTA